MKNQHTYPLSARVVLNTQNSTQSSPSTYFDIHSRISANVPESLNKGPLSHLLLSAL